MEEMSMRLNTIKICFKDGGTSVWKADEGDWDDYMSDGKFFIIKKNEINVGYYNLDCVMCIVIL